MLNFGENSMSAINTLEKVNRVEVIDESGRAYTCYNAENVVMQLQDDGKTLKLFVDWDGSEKNAKAKLESILKGWGKTNDIT
jgi:hypothetical protein